MSDTATPTPDAPDAGTDMRAHRYRCPHCGTVYDHELITRVHITRADDDIHRTRHGLMPECEIEVLDETDAVIERRSRRPADIDLEELTREDFPDGLTEKRRSGVYIAAKHPEIDDYEELAARLETELAETPYDPPAARTIGRAVDELYYSHVEDSTESRSFAELTPLQQAILITDVGLASPSPSDIQAITGCSKNYPRQTKDTYSDAHDDIATAYASGTDLETIIAERLTPSAIQALMDSETLTEAPVDLSASLEAAAAETAVTDDAADSPAVDRGSPIEDADVMSAGPSLPNDSDSPASAAGHTESPAPDAETPSAPDQASSPDAKPSDVSTTQSTDASGAADHVEPPATDAATATTSDEPDAPAMTATDTADADSACVDDSTAPTGRPGDPRTEIRQLKREVTFLKNALSPVVEPDTHDALVISLAERVEQRCEAIDEQFAER